MKWQQTGHCLVGKQSNEKREGDGVRYVSKRTGNISLEDCGLRRAQGLASDPTS